MPPRLNNDFAVDLTEGMLNAIRGAAPTETQETTIDADTPVPFDGNNNEGTETQDPRVGFAVNEPAHVYFDGTNTTGIDLVQTQDQLTTDARDITFTGTPLTTTATWTATNAEINRRLWDNFTGSWHLNVPYESISSKDSEADVEIESLKTRIFYLENRVEKLEKWINDKLFKSMLEDLSEKEAE